MRGQVTPVHAVMAWRSSVARRSCRKRSRPGLDRRCERGIWAQIGPKRDRHSNRGHDARTPSKPAPRDCNTPFMAVLEEMETPRSSGPIVPARMVRPALGHSSVALCLLAVCLASPRVPVAGCEQSGPERGLGSPGADTAPVPEEYLPADVKTNGDVASNAKRQAELAVAWGLFNHQRKVRGELDSESGPGSSIEFTQTTRDFLRDVIERYQVRTILDVACGDWHWMQHVDLAALGVRSYVGYDINGKLIADNARRHGSAIVSFVHASMLTAPLPSADLVIARDVLFHLNNAHIHTALAAIRASNSSLLLTTTFPWLTRNSDLPVQPNAYLGFRAQPHAPVWGYRAVNLDLAPFYLEDTGIESLEEQWGDDEQDIEATRLLKLYALPGRAAGERAAAAGVTGEEHGKGDCKGLWEAQGGHAKSSPDEESRHAERAVGYTQDVSGLKGSELKAAPQLAPTNSCATGPVERARLEWDQGLCTHELLPKGIPSRRHYLRSQNSALYRDMLAFSDAWLPARSPAPGGAAAVLGVANADFVRLWHRRWEYPFHMAALRYFWHHLVGRGEEQAFGGQRVLCTGVGGGFFPHYVADKLEEAGIGGGRVLEVVGDASFVKALHALRHSVGQAESEAGVEVKLGALDALPLAAASVDAILCVSALHEVDNKVAALTEFARVLRAGGMLSVSLTLAHCSACTTDEGHHSLGGAQRLLKVMGSLGFDEIDAPYSVREDLGESAAQGDVILTSSWMAQEDPASMPWASRRAEEHLTISCHIFRKRS